MLRLLDDHLRGPSEPARRLLDVGCGTGTMLMHLRRYGRTYGVDMDHEAVGYCRERGLDTVVQASAGNLPFADGTFDLVTMLDVLEHIVDEGGALTEVRRVVRPGGLLMVAVPAYRFLWGAQDEVSQHQRRYTARHLKEQINAAGLEIRRLTHFNSFLFPPIAAIRLVRRAVPHARSHESDFNFPAPGPLNAVLASIFGFESAIVPRANLPFGVSILCLAEKPFSAQARADRTPAAGATPAPR
jgi:ubiquinone/menaquinone biosynthesis C-methylase UbiE